LAGGGISGLAFGNSGKGGADAALGMNARFMFFLRPRVQKGVRMRTGFTLVEVIVVLVILAILAAIAIPALTGYIDKATWMQFKSETRTQMMAVQTMLVEQYEKDGGFTAHDYTSNYKSGNLSGIPADENWVLVRSVTNAAIEDTGYVFSRFTQHGLDVYEDLTGDTQILGVYSPTDGVHGRPNAYTDSAGAIKVYRYIINQYFSGSYDTLQVIYIANKDSTDPGTLGFLASMEIDEPGVTAKFTNGFGVYRVKDDTPSTTGDSVHTRLD
jgi:prepilin-type N-terminal cleavage/methylation domain-containing protein